VCILFLGIPFISRASVHVLVHRNLNTDAQRLLRVLINKLPDSLNNRAWPTGYSPNNYDQALKSRAIYRPALTALNIGIVSMSSAFNLVKSFGGKTASHRWRFGTRVGRFFIGDKGGNYVITLERAKRSALRRLQALAKRLIATLRRSRYVFAY